MVARRFSETPEIYGAEHLLTRRAQTPDIGRKLIERIRWWEEYCARNGASMDNNPSSGNKAGGLTTVLEKSLGGIAKAGSTNLVEVYQYAEPVRAHGLVFMDTPGYDPVSATGQRGRRQSDLLHHRPRLRLAARRRLFAGHQHRPVRRQADDMDLNCGDVLDGTRGIAELGAILFEQLLATASGAPSRSERHGYGQQEFVPWQISVIT